MAVIKVKKLWEDGELVGACNILVGMDCATFNMGSLRPVWVQRKAGCCGNGGTTTITFKNPNDANALSGVWVESNGRGIVLDAVDVAAVVDKCNLCCGEDTTVEAQFDGVIPAIDEGADATFCVTRSDDGSYLAVNQTYLDYLGKYTTMVHKSNAGGVSKYEIKAKVKPVGVGADVVATGVCA
jgi:hypothetical protein